MVFGRWFNPQVSLVNLPFAGIPVTCPASARLLPGSAWCPFKPQVKWISMQLANGTCKTRALIRRGDHHEMAVSWKGWNEVLPVRLFCTKTSGKVWYDSPMRFLLVSQVRTPAYGYGYFCPKIRGTNGPTFLISWGGKALAASPNNRTYVWDSYLFGQVFSYTWWIYQPETLKDNQPRMWVFTIFGLKELQSFDFCQLHIHPMF